MRTAATTLGLQPPKLRPRPQHPEGRLCPLKKGTTAGGTKMKRRKENLVSPQVCNQLLIPTAMVERAGVPQRTTVWLQGIEENPGWPDEPDASHTRNAGCLAVGGLLCQCWRLMLESPRPDSCTMTRAKGVAVPSAGGPAWGCTTRAVARSGRLGHRAPDADQRGVGTKVSHSVPTVALLVSSPRFSREQTPGPWTPA